MTPISKPTVLFDASVGTQSVHVSFEWRDGNLLLSSHGFGPALVYNLDEDESETFITVRRAQLPHLARALGCPTTPRSIEAAIVERYRGDSNATSHLMALLADNVIPYEFYSI